MVKKESVCLESNTDYSTSNQPIFRAIIVLKIVPKFARENLPLALEYKSATYVGRITGFPRVPAKVPTIFSI
jgi:hypothetical protein